MNPKTPVDSDELQSFRVPVRNRLAGNASGGLAYHRIYITHGSHTLATLRDTLPPRLVSSQPRVAEVEDLLENRRDERSIG